MHFTTLILGVIVAMVGMTAAMPVEVDQPLEERVSNAT